MVYEPVRLQQDFRYWDFEMPWEGPEYGLPGDEKAVPQAPGAPSPAPPPTAAPKVAAAPPPPTPKVTDKPSETGAGAPAEAQATKEARKPRAKKAAGPKPTAIADPDTAKDTPAKPGRTRAKKGGSDA